MPVYAGRVHPDLREDFTHSVTVTAPPVDDADKYDDWGNPVAGIETTGVPALWVSKVKESVQNDNAAVVAFVTVYLPHDMPIAEGYTLLNESTGVKGKVVATRPPIYADDESIPYTAWIEGDGS